MKIDDEYQETDEAKHRQLSKHGLYNRFDKLGGFLQGTFFQFLKHEGHYYQSCQNDDRGDTQHFGVFVLSVLSVLSVVVVIAVTGSVSMVITAAVLIAAFMFGFAVVLAWVGCAACRVDFCCWMI